MNSVQNGVSLRFIAAALGLTGSLHRQTRSTSYSENGIGGNARPHPGPTAIELGACCSKHDFFDPPLKMIRTIQRQFGPGRFALEPHRDRSAQEHALELFNYLLDRQLTVKQLQQMVFHGVISHSTIYL